MILLQCSDLELTGVNVLLDEESPYVVEYLDENDGTSGPTWKPVMSHASLQPFGNMRTRGEAELHAETMGRMLSMETRLLDKKTKEVIWP